MGDRGLDTGSIHGAKRDSWSGSVHKRQDLKANISIATVSDFVVTVYIWLVRFYHNGNHAFDPFRASAICQN